MNDQQLALNPLLGGLHENPIITGLWQVADLEKQGTPLDVDRAAEELVQYAKDGFTYFDMADHYGSAEVIACLARIKLSKSNVKPRLLTKWCPQPHLCKPDDVKRGIDERRYRLGVETIDLLQLHWWTFDHPGYIDVMDELMRLKQDGWIANIGLTNFDTDHLKVLLNCGHDITTNQVCLSVLDPRALAEMSELCHASGVRLLAYGTLAGGFLSERWLNHPEPATISDWSKMKYHRFIHAAGGWEKFQQVLKTLHDIAQQHQVTIANVATRWVLEQPAVAGAIVGARVTEQHHRDNNKQLLNFRLNETNHEQLSSAMAQLNALPGDCGSEYRRPPYLTASGDLSDHLDALPSVFTKEPVPDKPNAFRISSGSEYEHICGYSRAVQRGNRILVSGTTATHGHDRVIGENDFRTQTIYILDKISASLAAFGASMNDVVRTRIYLTDVKQWEAVSRVHGRYFNQCLPANTLIEVSRLVGPYQVEIEAEALLDEHPPPSSS